MVVLHNCSWQFSVVLKSKSNCISFQNQDTPDATSSKWPKREVGSPALGAETWAYQTLSGPMLFAMMAHLPLLRSGFISHHLPTCVRNAHMFCFLRCEPVRKSLDFDWHKVSNLTRHILRNDNMPYSNPAKSHGFPCWPLPPDTLLRMLRMSNLGWLFKHQLLV